MPSSDYRSLGSLSASLARADGEKFGSRVFLCLNNRRHLLVDISKLNGYGLSFPDDVIDVDEELIDNMRPGQMLPRIWSDDERRSPPSEGTSWDLREIAGSRLSGFGLEIGALAAPFPVPVHCNVMYGDAFSHAELMSTYPDQPITDLVIPTLKTVFEDLKEVNQGSLDFIIASHVIEHTRDPIGAITNAYDKLRPGGSLVLVIPDRDRTFDRKRPLTTLEHLKQDYYDPSHERDAQHHQEYHSLAFPADPEKYESIWRYSWNTQKTIHYHTWLYETFGELVDWVIDNTAPFKSVWSHRTLPHPVNDFEFYFTLTK
ncbi:class I SAM-dependent methyltransferase [Methylobacterium brachiatum]|uniref:class I SAM-dependent methyltransferase n=1 Tax=Methylobacterium brachiatum TaxID=269660 RepID=UPI0024477679|nr:methyltransferase domain-containing protein [Methylobacterium brachiatum]MDH2311413.1 methyltransferase domain-containing protein [Methylobacterium brachiatum]